MQLKLDKLDTSLGMVIYNEVSLEWNLRVLAMFLTLKYSSSPSPFQSKHSQHFVNSISQVPLIHPSLTWSSYIQKTIHWTTIPCSAPKQLYWTSRMIKWMLPWRLAAPIHIDVKIPQGKKRRTCLTSSGQSISLNIQTNIRQHN